MALQPFALAQVRAEWLALENEKLAPELKKFNFERQRIRPLILEMHQLVSNFWYSRLVNQEVIRDILQTGQEEMLIEFGPECDVENGNQAYGQCVALCEAFHEQLNVFWRPISAHCFLVTLTPAIKP